MKREKQYTEKELKRLEELRAEKEIIKKKSAKIQAEITKIIMAESTRYRHQQTYMKHPKKSIAIEMFGKRYKDLSKEELREFEKIRQREHRKKLSAESVEKLHKALGVV